MLFVSIALVWFHQTKTIEPKGDQTFEQRMSDKEFPFNDYYFQKQYPEKSFDYSSYLNSMQKAADELNIHQSSQGQWETQGPGNIGARVNTIAVDDDNDAVIYLGFSQGGLWKTEDAGNSWNPIFDDRAYLAISDVEIDPSDNQTIYVGTGDLNISGYPFIGDGIHKSIDGGISWQNIGLIEASIISEVHVSDQNPEIIYASAMGIPFEKNENRGLYKSLDSGNSWEQVLFINDSTGVIDILVHPTNDNIVYAAGWNRIRNNNISKITGPDAKIWKTTDGGTTWDVLENGLPTGDLTRIGLAMSGSNSKKIYASYTKPSGSDECETGGIDLQGIYISEDGGDSWNPIPTSEASNSLPCNTMGGFGWYFGRLFVNPMNDNDISILGVWLWRTLDGGQTWSYADDTHADKHDMVYSNGNFYLGTDGGAYKMDQNGFDNWVDIENIPTTQFYRVAYNPWRPDEYFGGAQDNGTMYGNIEDINGWDRYFGGDGFTAAFHKSNPNIAFAEYQNGAINMTIDGLNGNWNYVSDGLEGSRSWDMVYALSHHNDDALYTGTDRMFSGIINGDQVDWTAISPILADTVNPNSAIRHQISTFSESSINPNLIYVGTNDGLLSKTTNLGSDWVNINGQIPRRYVTDIKASDIFENVVYTCISGYKYNDFTPLIYKSEDQGETWKSIAGNLPNLSINHIHVLKTNDDTEALFVATDGGVYFSINDGDVWQRLGDNMPIIPVYDLAYNKANHQIVAGTFARSIQSFDLSQIEMVSSVENNFMSINEVSIYPTVSDSKVSITSLASGIVSIDIFDQKGKRMKSISVSKSIELDITSYPMGTYFFRCVNEDGKTLTKRIIKI